MADDLAKLTDIEVGKGIAKARYRLITCSGGCSAAGFELSWRGADGRWTLVTRGLDAEQRNTVMRKLDAAMQTRER